MKKKAIRTINEDMAKKYPMTISKELWQAWQLMRRLDDATKIRKKVKKCRIIVDRALNYGHVKNMKLAEQISHFFENRIKEEQKEAITLMRLAEENN